MDSYWWKFPIHWPQAIGSCQPAVAFPDCPVQGTHCLLTNDPLYLQCLKLLSGLSVSPQCKSCVSKNLVCQALEAQVQSRHSASIRGVGVWLALGCGRVLSTRERAAPSSQQRRAHGFSPSPLTLSWPYLFLHPPWPLWGLVPVTLVVEEWAASCICGLVLSVPFCD